MKRKPKQANTTVTSKTDNALKCFISIYFTISVIFLSKMLNQTFYSEIFFQAIQNTSFFNIPNLNLSGYVIIYYLYDIYWNVRTVICENYSVQTQKLTNYFQFLITGIIMLGKNINHYILRLKGLNVDEIGSFFFLFLKTQLYNHHIFLFVY